ncbi:hypothetical protein EKO04_005082 [Ascochyta lentis]|uniref:F-box domain-containing protein n=1 Tax=Ascochyta lentis TaxID=205686 RepID=A0A8H7J375_9PLEO|nr:hypothetical protein EKO04_005082 [Ascochyta lentis]
MATCGLAEAFARLSTSDSRQNALKALFAELTPHEWRFVKSLASNQTFQLDIIGQLPLELVSHVFSYLDTTVPWQLQLVSRLWYEKLRNVTVLKSNLESWYAATVNLQGADLEFCQRKARSVCAFRNGPRSAQPDSSFKISAKLGLTQLLAGDNLIWLDENHHQVRVWNMRSWTSQTFNGTARERIRDVYASEELLVFATHTTAYVAKLDSSGPLRRFRVSNARLLSVITCRGRTVACAGHLQEGLLVYIWNFDTQQGRSINLSHHVTIFSGDLPALTACQSEIGLLLQPGTETIVLCVLNCDMSRNVTGHPKILYYRFTYAGECLHSAEHVLERYDHDQLTHSDRRGLRFVPASYDGLFMLQSRAVCQLQFDESLCAFTTPTYPGLNSTGLRHQSQIVWWRNTFVEAGTERHIVIHRGTACNPCHDPLITYDEPKPMQTEARDRRDLLINDLYIVRPYCDAFHICCYDHTVQLPGKEGILEGVGLWEVMKTSSRA